MKKKLSLLTAFIVGISAVVAMNLPSTGLSANAKAESGELNSTVLTAETLNAGTAADNPWKKTFDYWKNKTSVTYTQAGVEVVGNGYDNGFNIINGPMSISDGAILEMTLNLPLYDNGVADTSLVKKAMYVLYNANTKIGASAMIWGDSYTTEKAYVTAEFTVGNTTIPEVKLPKSIVEKNGEGVKLGFTVEDGWYAEVYDETTETVTYAPVLESPELDTALSALTVKEVTRIQMSQKWNTDATKTHVVIKELNGQNLCLDTNNQLEITNSFNASSLKVAKDIVFTTGNTYNYELVGVESNNATVNTNTSTASVWQKVHVPLMGDIGWNSDGAKGECLASGIYLTLKKANEVVGEWSNKHSWGSSVHSAIEFTIPDEVGTYTLEVKLLTVKGNVTIQSVDFQAVAEPHIVLNKSLEEQVVQIPTAYLCGSDGVTSLTDEVSVSVTFGDIGVEIQNGIISVSEIGEYTVIWTVTYETISYEKTVTFNVLADEIKTISVTKEPTKTQYVAGETFDPTGMEVTATYESGKTEIVTGYTVDKTILNTDDKTVVIAYQGKKTVLLLSVKEKQKESEKESSKIEELLGGCFGSSGIASMTIFLIAGVAIAMKRKKS